MCRWPWQKRDMPVTEGTIARVQAQRDLDHYRRLRPEVTEVASNLRWLRLRNHFSEQIQDLIEEGPGR